MLRWQFITLLSDAAGWSAVVRARQPIPVIEGEPQRGIQVDAYSATTPAIWTSTNPARSFLAASAKCSACLPSAKLYTAPNPEEKSHACAKAQDHA
jgi:hypothetical protein